MVKMYANSTNIGYIYVIGYIKSTKNKVITTNVLYSHKSLGIYIYSFDVMYDVIASLQTLNYGTPKIPIS